MLHPHAHLGLPADAAWMPAPMAAAKSSTLSSSAASTTTLRGAHSQRRAGERRKVAISRRCSRTRRQGSGQQAAPGTAFRAESISLKGTAGGGAWRPQRGRQHVG